MLGITFSGGIGFIWRLDNTPMRIIPNIVACAIGIIREKFGIFPLNFLLAKCHLYYLLLTTLLIELKENKELLKKAHNKGKQ
jgi:membrane protein YqaA with SNARE-associated domain